MLEYGTFILGIVSAWIAYLQLKNTFPSRPAKKIYLKHKGVPNRSFLLRSIFTKYPRIVFLIPLAFFFGIEDSRCGSGWINNFSDISIYFANTFKKI